MQVIRHDSVKVIADIAVNLIVALPDFIGNPAKHAQFHGVLLSDPAEEIPIANSADGDEVLAGSGVIISGKTIGVSFWNQRMAVIRQFVALRNFASQSPRGGAGPSCFGSFIYGCRSHSHFPGVNALLPVEGRSRPPYSIACSACPGIGAGPSAVSHSASDSLSASATASPRVVPVANPSTAGHYR